MLYIIRHGETVWNAEKRMQGHHDSPLTLKGVAQAEHYAKILTHHIDKNDNINKHNIENFDFVVSPLGRTQRTAQIVLDSLNLKKDIISEPLAKERNHGIWEGQSCTVIAEHYKKQQDQWNYRSENEESREMFYNRVYKLFNKYKNKKTILITHGGVSLFLRAIVGKTNKNFDEIVEKHGQHKQDEIFLVENNKDVKRLKLEL